MNGKKSKRIRHVARAMAYSGPYFSATLYDNKSVPNSAGQIDKHSVIRTVALDSERALVLALKREYRADPITANRVLFDTGVPARTQTETLDEAGMAGRARWTWLRLDALENAAFNARRIAFMDDEGECGYCGALLDNMVGWACPACGGV